MKGHTAPSAEGEAQKTVTSGGNQTHASQGTFPVQSTKDMLNSSSSKLQQHMRSLVHQGSSSGPRRPGFLSAVSHTDTLSLAHTKIPDSQRQASAQQYKPHLLYKQLKNSEPLLSGNSGDLLEVQLRASLASSFKPAHYSFCTRDLSICWCYGLLLSVCVSSFSLSLYIYTHTHMYPIYVHPVCIYT